MGHPAEKDQKNTYKDYLLTPSDKRYELIEGDLVMVPAPSTWHQRVSRNIEYHLHRFVSERDRGQVFDAPCDVLLDNETVVQPDILFITKDREGIIAKENIRGAPDLVIEILSPTSGYYDLVKKKNLYRRFGVKEYWLVDPEERTCEVLSLEAGAYRTHQSAKDQGKIASGLLAGFELDLADMFF